MLFINVVLPVFLIVFTGYLLQKKYPLDSHALTTVSLYILSPALVFSALTKHPVSAELTGDLTLFMVLYTVVLLVLGCLSCRVGGISRESRRAFYLATSMMNIGNFGLPLAYFAYGDSGLKVSVLIFVLFNIPLGTLAIIIAQGEKTALKDAIINMLKIPIFHAVVLAFGLQAIDIQPPSFLLRACDLLGQGAIPLMLVILGMQLARTRIEASFRFLGLASLLRLVIAPIIAWLLTGLLGIDGLPRNVIVLQTSTPAAVLPLLYSIRFNSRPDLVASAILVTTLLSAITLTILLYVLQ